MQSVDDFSHRSVAHAESPPIGCKRRTPLALPAEPAGQGRFPASYVPAELRCVLPVDPANPRLALGFDLPDGAVQRLHISEESARALVRSLQLYWPALMGVDGRDAEA